MNLSIQTAAEGGHVIVYVINSHGVRILSVTENNQGSCTLVPGANYRFEFHVWGADSASYEIHASVNPSSAGFEPFDFQRPYQGPHQDMGGFYFTA